MREKRYDEGMKGTGKTYSEPEEKKAEYRVVVLGCLKNLNTEKEVVEEYVNYLSAIVAKKEAMSFSVIYGDDKKIMGAIVATGHQIEIISGGRKMAQLVNKMRNESTLYLDRLTPAKLFYYINYTMS